MSDELDDVIFEVLAHSRRRQVCEVLAAADREYFPIERLAERLVDRESAEEAPTDDRTRSVAVQLYHVHLPKLADAGLLEFDAEMQAVTYEGHPVVEAIAEGELTVESSTEANVDLE